MITNSMSYRSIHNNNDRPDRQASAGRKQSGIHLRPYTIRLLAAAVVFTLLFSGFAIMQSYASGDRQQPAEAGEQVMIASAGDTLWAIATEVKARGMDTREAVYLIKDRNGLQNGVLKAGQFIIIPKSVRDN